MKEKYYYVYKIIFLCGEYKGHYYIGAHYGSMFDNYCGSGKICKEYYNKYGKIATYRKETICICACKEHATRLEKELIATHINDSLCENIKIVGHTGCHKPGTGKKYVSRPKRATIKKGSHWKIVDGKRVWY